MFIFYMMGSPQAEKNGFYSNSKFQQANRDKAGSSAVKLTQWKRREEVEGGREPLFL